MKGGYYRIPSTWHSAINMIFGWVTVQRKSQKETRLNSEQKVSWGTDKEMDYPTPYYERKGNNVPDKCIACVILYLNCCICSQLLFHQHSKIGKMSPDLSIMSFFFSCTTVTFDCHGHHRKSNDSRNGLGISQANLLCK